MLRMVEASCANKTRFASSFTSFNRFLANSLGSNRGLLPPAWLLFSWLDCSCEGAISSPAYPALHQLLLSILYIMLAIVCDLSDLPGFMCVDVFSLWLLQVLLLATFTSTFVEHCIMQIPHFQAKVCMHATSRPSTEPGVHLDLLHCAPP